MKRLSFPGRRKRLDSKVKELIGRIAEHCTERKIDPAMVANRKEVNDFVIKLEADRAEESPLMREGWRRGVLEAIL